MHHMTFKGYERPDGTAGTRNIIGVVSTVVCANEVAKWVSSVKGAKAFVHGQGCAQTSPDIETVTNTLISLGRNPNLAAILLVGLGCESVDIQRVADGISGSGKPVETVVVQEVGGARRAKEIGRRRIRVFSAGISASRRNEIDVSRLVLGLKCGASDTTSGISANPALGRAVDAIVDEGGSIVFGETTEFIGAEGLIASRGRTKEVKNKILDTIIGMEERAKRMGVDMRGGQPTQGNIKGGLSTIEEKSLGAAIKTGSRLVDGVLSYGERIPGRGTYMIDSPGREPELLTGLAAGGATVLVFTTGRGAPQGFPFVPVLKVTGNPVTARRLADHIDVDVSAILEGEMDIDEGGRIIREAVVEVASGKAVKAERLAYEESMNIYVVGPVI